MFMIRITYWELLLELTIIFVTVFICDIIWHEKINVQKLNKMIILFVTAAVLTRIVYFPMRHVNGHIGFMKINKKVTIPFRHNFRPIIRLFEYYDDWFINIIGNIVIFIPVGIVWPVCFNKLNSVKKTVLAGAGLSVFIEITQLFQIERCTDIDDVILNTTGAFIGAVIYFRIKKRTRNQQSENELKYDKTEHNLSGK